jgi:hypothetical protein
VSAWGRKEYASWPSRKPVWTLGALFAAVLFFLLGMMAQYARNWSFVERFYLPVYARTWLRGLSPKAEDRYRLLAAVDRKGKQQIAIAGEVEPATNDQGEAVYVLTEEAERRGLVRLVWNDGMFNDRRLHAFLGHWIYQDQTVWDYIERPAYASLGVFVLLLFLAVPKDRQRALVLKHGRRLRGPELVRTAEFNARHEADGLAFVNQEQTFTERTLRKNASRWVRIPRQREAMHFLVMGDSGTGKSAAIRQILAQVWERGDAAIVYDPAMEYLPQFYNPQRGDVILNPVDERCPFWSPGDEVPHEAEALTLAASLFPDQGRDNRFFVEAPRKIFAHLLNLHPTPEQLTYWLCHAEEIDRRVRGTEMEAMIDPRAAQQRSGVLGSLNMVADAFKLLPREGDAKQRWSAAEWAKERKGWIFLTSRPTMRERLRPLLSLWLDLLVLRLMNDGNSAGKPVWFVLDELASLQRLPQLMTAITENRKSNNPMVLGFQGKAQLEALYGHMAEVLLSQPATKIFLKTSEPNAAEWISRAIGEVEIERFRESRTRGQFPRGRRSESEQREIQKEALVMASEISGLDPLHGYLKYGNLVVRMRFPYLELAEKHERFIERKTEAPLPQPPAPAAPEPVAPTNAQELYFE